MSQPSIAELRAVGQPEALLRRPGAEHWAGRLYMRRVSPYLTRALVPTRVSANTVTALMIPTALAAAAVLTLPGLGGALGAAALVQLYLLLDCSDGELARWRQTFSPKGIYLDQIGHYVAEGSLPAALGVRADGGWDSLGGWTTLGLAVSALVLVLKAETHLVWFSRARAGLGTPPASANPRVRTGARRALATANAFRPFQAIEASLLALAAAIVDEVGGGLTATRTLLLALLGAAVFFVVAHLARVVRSDALRGGEGVD